MNRRQRKKFIPPTWIIAIKQSEGHAYYALYAIDWKRGGRLSWEAGINLKNCCNFIFRSNEKSEDVHSNE